MRRIHSTALAFAGIVVCALSLLAAPTAAFARIVQSPPDGGPATAPGHGSSSVLGPVSSGVAGWEVALITAGAVLLTALVTAAVARIRFRHAPQPAGA